MFPVEADLQLVSDFFVYVIFCGLRNLQCDGDCERNIQILIEAAS